jgi:hypothetical protein
MGKMSFGVCVRWESLKHLLIERKYNHCFFRMQQIYYQSLTDQDFLLNQPIDALLFLNMGRYIEIRTTAMTILPQSSGLQDWRRKIYRTRHVSRIKAALSQTGEPAKSAFSRYRLHGNIGYVTPAQRHCGDDKAILARRRDRYAFAGVAGRTKMEDRQYETCLTGNAV